MKEVNETVTISLEKYNRLIKAEREFDKFKDTLKDEKYVLTVSSHYRGCSYVTYDKCSYSYGMHLIDRDTFIKGLVENITNLKVGHDELHEKICKLREFISDNCNSRLRKLSERI